MQVGIVSHYTELVLHGLAHLPIAGASSLYAPRYVAWVQQSLPRSAWSPLAGDARLIAAHHQRAAAALALESFFQLHATGAELRRAVGTELFALTDANVATPAALATLRQGDPVGVEVFRSDLALASNAFETVFAARIAPALEASRQSVEQELLAACAIWPTLEGTTVQVGHALGPRGRGWPERIVVGAPAEWNDVTAGVTAVLVCHEHAVLTAAAASAPGLDFAAQYVQSEWAALGEVARRLAGTRLARDHAAWLAGVELGPLGEAATRANLVSAHRAREIVHQPAHRAELFAALPPLAPFA